MPDTTADLPAAPPSRAGDGDGSADLLALFARHMDAEMDGDLQTTMATMTADPHLTHVPVMAGGSGREEVRTFYSEHLVGRFLPPDVEIVPVSRTVGSEQIVEEMVLRFTHSTAIDWMLPNVEPTGRRIEVAVVVIVRVTDGLIAHEHIYWDQASVLAQTGLLDPAGLPVCGAESARRVLDPGVPSPNWWRRPAQR